MIAEGSPDGGAASDRQSIEIRRIGDDRDQGGIPSAGTWLERDRRRNHITLHQPELIDLVRRQRREIVHFQDQQVLILDVADIATQPLSLLSLPRREMFQASRLPIRTTASTAANLDQVGNVLRPPTLRRSRSETGSGSGGDPDGRSV